MSDIWHFPRPELAENYLRQFNEFGLKRITLFAPRRTGKTQFLIKDLAPAAEQAGYLVCYVSMWEQKDAPHTALKDCFDDAKKRIEQNKSMFSRFFAAKINKVKFDSEVPGLGKFATDIEFAENPKKASAGELQELLTSYKSFQEVLGKKPFLLLIDEIQHLATNAKFEPLTYTLRTILDMSPDNIRVIFTGSSRSGLTRLFRDSKAPFFNFADTMKFPLLGEDFVLHLESVYQKVSGKSLNHSQLLEIFEALDHNAFYMHALIKTIAMQAFEDLDSAYKELLDNIADESEFETLWDKLTVAERYVFGAISAQIAIFSEDNLSELKHSEWGRLDRMTLQRALLKLEQKGLIFKEGHGKYNIEQDTLLRWARRNKKLLLSAPRKHST